MTNTQYAIFMQFLLFFILFCSVSAAALIYKARATEEGRRPAKGCRYHSFMSNTLFGYFPLIVITLFVDLFLSGTPDLTLLPPLIIMGVFQCILLMLQPLLRKVITARTCATLWTLLSFTLFFLTRMMRVAFGTLLTIPLPIHISPAIFSGWLYVWLAGFVGILVWHTVSHLIFRRKLLKDIRPAESTVVRIWLTEEAIANIPVGSYQVVISPAAQTPLSIGLFRRSTLVVLPEKEYTEEELKLILRHELIHICRRDPLAKFGILFLTAFFWFNPLMWIAMRCCADDLELSCDETVLFGYEGDVRRRYGNLLLNTAADQRGFTTCLSATARALRYRLKNVIIPRKRLTGGIVVGIVFFLLFFSCIFVNFSYNPGTVQESIFQNRDPKDYTLTDSVITAQTNQIVAESEENHPELVAYLFQLPVSSLMKDVQINWDADLGQFELTSPDYRYTLWLTDDVLRVYDPSTAEISYYRVGGTLDWAFITQQVSN